MSDVVVTKSEESIAKGSQSFAAAARLFDRKTRDDAVMLYAWCRHCDDIIDGQVLGMQSTQEYRAGQHERLDKLKAQTAAALTGARSDDYYFDALRRVVSRHDIPHAHPLELLHGFEMDVENRQYETIDELMEYCYHVAGVVGVMMARIMGSQDRITLDRACDLGLAFQLTNIARDIVDDARAGRVYLPAAILRRHGLANVSPEDRSTWPKLYLAALDLLNIADDYYASSYNGLSALPARSAWAIATARRVYREIGNKIRLAGPRAWERRVSTTKLEKMLLLTMSLADVGTTRVGGAGMRPNNLWCRPGR